MKYLVAALLLLVSISGGAYYYFLYPPVALKHKTEHALNDFNTTVAGKDRTKIKEHLEQLLTDTSRIRLEIQFLSVLTQNNPAVVQNFDKKGFLAFLDNVLYPLQDYYFKAQILTFKLRKDKQQADVVFSSPSWAEDAAYFGMAHFTADITCNTDVIFNAGQVNVDDADCKVHLTALPKHQ